MVTKDFLDAPKLCASKPCIALQAERIKPELSKLVVAFNMDMGRFIAIPCIKEEAIWTDSQCSWHLLKFHSIFLHLNAPAHCAPPRRALLISPKPQRGSDTVERKVRRDSLQ